MSDTAELDDESDRRDRERTEARLEIVRDIPVRVIDSCSIWCSASDDRSIAFVRHAAGFVARVREGRYVASVKSVEIQLGRDEWSPLLDVLHCWGPPAWGNAR
jgi:hypothetical protein